MANKNFDNAGFLLAEAADHIAQAVRLITREAAKAKHITKDMSRMDPDWRHMTHATPPATWSMQDLTELASKLGGHHDQIRAYGLWFGTDDEDETRV